MPIPNLESLISSIDGLKAFEDAINSLQKKQRVEFLGKFALESIKINDIGDFTTMMMALPPELYTSYVEKKGPDLVKVLKPRDFEAFHLFHDSEKCKLACEAMKTILPQIIQTPLDLALAVVGVPPEACERICIELGDKFDAVITSGEDLEQACKECLATGYSTAWKTSQMIQKQYFERLMVKMDALSSTSPLIEQAVTRLKATLNEAKENYFEKGGDYRTFRRTCNNALQQASDSLKTYPTWKAVLAQVAMFISTAGILNAIVAGYSLATRGSVNFFGPAAAEGEAQKQLQKKMFKEGMEPEKGSTNDEGASPRHG